MPAAEKKQQFSIDEDDEPEQVSAKAPAPVQTQERKEGPK
jgi:hypothetical protein